MRNLFCSASTAALLIGGMLGLSACTPSTLAANTATVNSDLAIAVTDAQKAVTFYGIAKGIETIACPASVTTDTCNTARAIVAKVDPIVVKIEAAIPVATTDATVLEGLVKSVNDEAVELENQTAGAISVVKNAT